MKSEKLFPSLSLSHTKYCFLFNTVADFANLSERAFLFASLYMYISILQWRQRVILAALLQFSGQTDIFNDPVGINCKSLFYFNFFALFTLETRNNFIKKFIMDPSEANKHLVYSTTVWENSIRNPLCWQVCVWLKSFVSKNLLGMASNTEQFI